MSRNCRLREFARCFLFIALIVISAIAVPNVSFALDKDDPFSLGKLDPEILSQCIRSFGPDIIYNRIAANGVAIGLVTIGGAKNVIDPHSANKAFGKIYKSFSEMVLDDATVSTALKFNMSGGEQQHTQTQQYAASIPPALIDNPEMIEFCLRYVDLTLQGETPCFMGGREEMDFCFRMIRTMGPEPAAVPAECAGLPAAEAAECTITTGTAGLAGVAAVAGFCTGVTLSGYIQDYYCDDGRGGLDGWCDLADYICGQDGRNWVERHLRMWF